jgi:1-acyl-sn-glycerol-3-phosphate acyltransferase
MTAQVADPTRTYRFVFGILRLVIRLCFRVTVEGREHIPEGGFLVVSNHLSWTDTVFIAFALPPGQMIWTMANATSVFNTRFKRWLLPRLAVFPVRRQRGFLDEAAVQRVYDLLHAGEWVLIFPEGAYGRDGQLRPLKEGIGHFAINSGKPLLPVVLTGTGRLRPFSRVTVRIGQPFIPRVPVVWGIKARARAVVGVVGQRLAALGLRRRRPVEVVEINDPPADESAAVPEVVRVVPDNA